MIQEIKTKTEEILGLGIEKKLTKADYVFINNLSKPYMEEQSVIRLYIEMKNVGESITKEVLTEFKNIFDFYKKKTRVAIVGDEDCLSVLNIGDLVSPDIEVRCFSGAEKQEAMAWLEKDFI